MTFFLSVLKNLFYKIMNKKVQNNLEDKSLTTPKGYKKHRFQCWLCEGETDFACRPLTKDKIFNIDCSRCGVDNQVRVRAFK